MSKVRGTSGADWDGSGGADLVQRRRSETGTVLATVYVLVLVPEWGSEEALYCGLRLEWGC